MVLIFIKAVSDLGYLSGMRTKKITIFRYIIQSAGKSNWTRTRKQRIIAITKGCISHYNQSPEKRRPLNSAYGCEMPQVCLSYNRFSSSIGHKLYKRKAAQGGFFGAIGLFLTAEPSGMLSRGAGCLGNPPMRHKLSVSEAPKVTGTQYLAS